MSATSRTTRIRRRTSSSAGWLSCSGTRRRSSSRPRRWRTRSRCARRRKPGGVLLAEERTHVLVYEWGGPAIHSGLDHARRRPASAGASTPEHVGPRTTLTSGRVACVVLENTHRSSGGTVWPLDEFRAVVDAARERGAAVHLDGARLFNAAVAAGEPVSAWSSLADSVTVCFSKGLGCPFGAVLAGSAELIERAWEGKFLFGGALRQSGDRGGGDAVRARPATSTARRRPRTREASRRRDRPRPADVETNFVSHPRRAGPRGTRSRERGVARRRTFGPAGSAP